MQKLRTYSLSILVICFLFSGCASGERYAPHRDGTATYAPDKPYALQPAPPKETNDNWGENVGSGLLYLIMIPVYVFAGDGGTQVSVK